MLFIEPCLPTISRTVPTGPKWAYEIKHDGFRFICRCDHDRVRVFSRRGHDWTDRVPLIAEALAALRVKSVTIDGEGVVCGRDGVTDFNLMRAAVGRKGSRKAFLYAFDLLELDGVDLTRELWHERRKALARLLRQAADGIRLSEHLDGADGEIVFKNACALGLEGIVAKRRDRPRRSGGRRTGSKSRTRMRRLRCGSSTGEAPHEPLPRITLRNMRELGRTISSPTQRLLQTALALERGFALEAIAT